MATYSKELLSHSTNGRNIEVAATSSAGTSIHTCAAGTTYKDEIWLYACNTSSSDVKLTLEFGGTTSADDHIEITITTEAGWVLVCPGLLLQNGLIVKAFAASASAININGFVNNITD